MSTLKKLNIGLKTKVLVKFGPSWTFRVEVGGKMLPKVYTLRDTCMHCENLILTHTERTSTMSPDVDTQEYEY